MTKRKWLLAVGVVAVGVVAVGLYVGQNRSVTAQLAQLFGNRNDNMLYLDLVYGRVVIEMLPDLAPNHVARISQLVREGFYDGIVFHRVIDGFMAQTGDPTGTGRGGSGTNLNAEFSNEPHVRGIVSMARAASPNSADSQFFIVFADARFLDGQYTVWGRVVEGMEYVDQIRRGDPRRNGIVDNPDRIVRMQLASDSE